MLLEAALQIFSVPYNLFLLLFPAISLNMSWKPRNFPIVIALSAVYKLAAATYFPPQPQDIIKLQSKANPDVFLSYKEVSR